MLVCNTASTENALRKPLNYGEAFARPSRCLPTLPSQPRNKRLILCVSLPASLSPAAEHVIREYSTDLRSARAKKSLIVASPFWDADTTAEMISLAREKTLHWRPDIPTRKIFAGPPSQCPIGASQSGQWATSVPFSLGTRAQGQRPRSFILRR